MTLMTIACFQVNAQEISGEWRGILSFQGTELSVVFHITNQDGKYSCTMDSPDQGVTGIPVDNTTYDNGKLTFKAAELGMEYNADINESGNSMTGTFNQQGVSIPLTLTKKKE